MLTAHIQWRWIDWVHATPRNETLGTDFNYIHHNPVVHMMRLLVIDDICGTQAYLQFFFWVIEQKYKRIKICFWFKQKYLLFSLAKHSLKYIYFSSEHLAKEH